MRGAIAIARHEIAQRSFLPVAALALGFLPLLVGLLTTATSGLQYAATMAIIFVSWIAAFVIGMSLVGRPLHAGQLSFYFTRPIAGRAVVGGKLLGGLLVIAGAQLLLYVPGAARDMLGSQQDVRHVVGDILRDHTAIDLGPVPVMAIGCGFLGIGLVAGVLARSRSRWFLVDLAGIGFVVVEVVRIVKRIIAVEDLFWIEIDGRHHRLYLSAPPGTPFADLLNRDIDDLAARFHDRVHMLGVGLAIAAIVALFAAAAAAVVVGRTDRERAHAAMSTTLWSSLLAIGAVGIAISQWGMP